MTRLEELEKLVLEDLLEDYDLQDAIKELEGATIKEFGRDVYVNYKSGTIRKYRSIMIEKLEQVHIE